MRRARVRIIERALFLCALLSIGTAGIIVVLAVGDRRLPPRGPIAEFLTGTEWTPLFADPRFGVLPLVAGTCWSRRSRCWWRCRWAC